MTATDARATFRENPGRSLDAHRALNDRDTGAEAMCTAWPRDLPLAANTIGIQVVVFLKTGGLMGYRPSILDLHLHV